MRLAKAHILLAQYMLEQSGLGKGTSFDLDREVFVPLRWPSPRTATRRSRRCSSRSATPSTSPPRRSGRSGSSPPPGTHGDVRLARQAEQTATEVVARQSTAMLTRGRKVRLWRRALRVLVTKLHAVDAAVFNRPAPPDGLTIAFPDGISESRLQLAQSALALRSAQAASTKKLVQLVHPDWDEPAVTAEVEVNRRGAARAHA